jgi:hypothetical protein
MNNKQIGGLENATNKEYINKFKQIYNEMISIIKSKDIVKINDFEGKFMKMFYYDILKIFKSDNNDNKNIGEVMDNITEVMDNIAEVMDRFIGIEDIKHLFNDSLYKSKNHDKNTAFYDLIIETDKYIEKNQSEFISKKLDYDIFYFKLSNLVKNFDCKKKLGNVNNNLSLILHILSLKIICILNKIYIKYKLFSKLKEDLLTELYQCYGLRQGTYEISYLDENAKNNKLYISTQIILYDKLIEQDFCSPYELELIKQNTNKFDTPKKLAVLNGIISAITLSVIAAMIYAAVTRELPGAEFPLYVTPFLSILSTVLGTTYSQQYKQYFESSIKYIEDKGIVKEILKKWKADILKRKEDEVKRKEGENEDKSQYFFLKKWRADIMKFTKKEDFDYKKNQSCEQAYTNSMGYITTFNKEIAINYEKYLFQFEVYRKLFDLVCDDSADTNKIITASLFSNNEFNINSTDNKAISEEVTSQQQQQSIQSDQQREKLVEETINNEENVVTVEDYINSYNNNRTKKKLFYKLKKEMEAHQEDIDNHTNEKELFMNLQEDNVNNTMILTRTENMIGNIELLKDFLNNNPKIFEQLKKSVYGGSKTRKNKKSKKPKKYNKYYKRNNTKKRNT